MALKVKFSQTTTPLTIKSTGAATSTSSLTDVDNTTPDGGQTGAALVYDATTKTYKAEKIFEYVGDTPEINGGDF
jgi:hypothetical protein